LRELAAEFGLTVHARGRPQVWASGCPGAKGVFVSGRVHTVAPPPTRRTPGRHDPSAPPASGTPTLEEFRRRMLTEAKNALSK
jgi:hypothetical protein